MLFMDTENKLSKLLAEKGVFKGGFKALTSDQLDKLKGGLKVPGTNVNIGNCGNCSFCFNAGCN